MRLAKHLAAGGGDFKVAARPAAAASFGIAETRTYQSVIDPRGFAPAGTPTASLAGTPQAPLRSAGSLAFARSFHRSITTPSDRLLSVRWDSRSALRPVAETSK